MLRNDPKARISLPGTIDPSPLIRAIEDARSRTDTQAITSRSIRFVQIGAMDGLFADPLRALVQTRGWHGLLVEPLPHHFQALLKTYGSQPGLNYANVAVADHDGQIEMAHVPPALIQARNLRPALSGMATARLDRNPIRTFHQLQQSITVPCLTFASLAKQYDIRRFDVLQIDAEGLDYEILRQVDLERFGVQIVQFEYKLLTPEERSDAIEKLCRAGFVFKLFKNDLLAVREELATGINARARKIRSP